MIKRVSLGILDGYDHSFPMKNLQLLSFSRLSKRFILMQTLIGRFGDMLEMVPSLWCLLIKSNLVVVLSPRRLEITCSHLYLQSVRVGAFVRWLFYLATSVK